MGRQTLTVVPLPSSWSVTPVDVGEVAADVGNGSQFVLTGNEILFAHNTDVADHTVTVTSTGDSEGRAKDITAFTVPAGKIYVFQRFPLTGWLESDGKLYLAASHATIKFFVVQLNP